MPETERRNILLIEDNAANIMVAKEFIQQLNYSYVVATSGLEGIEKFKEFRFDVILMDIQMPGMSGVETSEQIQELTKSGAFPATPIIAMTANYATSDLTKWEAAGIEGVIPKPFNVKYFARMLAQYCKK